MKFKKLGQVTLAAAASVGLMLSLTACGPSNTIDFLYVTSSKTNPGKINVYKVDGEAGALIEIHNSPYPSGGRNPVADATSPNGKNLYVINHDDNTVVEFAIGTDGKLYPQQTCNTPGTFPVQLTVSPDGKYLYVVETYQPNFNQNLPGPGALIVYPLNDTGGLGPSNNCAPIANGQDQFFAVGNNPAGLTVLKSNAFVYVVNESGSTSNQLGPSVTGFQVHTDGTLTNIGTFPVGVAPDAIASDPTNRFVYVTDGAANQVIGFLVQTDGTLVPMQRPFPTDNDPVSITVDPRGQWVLVSNYNSGTVTDFSIDRATGNLSPNAQTPRFNTDAGPLCVVIEPAEGRYVYTANFLGSTVSGMYMDPNSGKLSATQNSPYFAAAQPTCGAAITHGNHRIQHVQP